MAIQKKVFALYVDLCVSGGSKLALKSKITRKQNSSTGSSKKSVFKAATKTMEASHLGTSLRTPVLTSISFTNCNDA